MLLFVVLSQKNGKINTKCSKNYKFRQQKRRRTTRPTPIHRLCSLNDRLLARISGCLKNGQLTCIA